MSATCVSVTSLSAPNPRTAASLSNFKSLLTVTAVEAFKSIVASPSILKTPLELCCTKEAASPKVSLFVLLSVSPVPSVWVSIVSKSAPNFMVAPSDLSWRPSVSIKSSESAAFKKTVPLSFGKLIVLSAVGSITDMVVSNASEVAPSKIIVPSS